jgi:hypothetical protein
MKGGQDRAALRVRVCFCCWRTPITVPGQPYCTQARALRRFLLSTMIFPILQSLTLHSL